jgi:hypothetical protein
MRPSRSGRGAVRQLLVRLSPTFAVAGVLLGLIGSWVAAYVVFAVGFASALAAWFLSTRR